MTRLKVEPGNLGNKDGIFYTGKNEDERHGEIKGNRETKQWKWLAKDVAHVKLQTRLTW